MKGLFEYDYVLDADENFFLKEIITTDTYMRMFGKNISFLNKGKCGNGGTTGFIDYALRNARGCLILVPNRSIVLSKENEYKENKEVCCVYGGCDTIDREAMVVIATYDQFPRLLKSLSSYGYMQSNPEQIWQSEFWCGRTIIIDEYHKLIDDSGYRNICHKITQLITKTDSGVILMSATPHWEYVDFVRKLVEKKKIITYNIRYDSECNKKIQVYEVRKRDLKSILTKVKNSPKNKHTCVFYNNVKGITDIIDHIGDDDCEILCSPENKAQLGKYYSESFSSEKKLHFMTSAYFTGHDIRVPITQCIIIGSPECQNMCLGERDIKQIIGRFREGIDGIHLFYMKANSRKDDYLSIKNEHDKNQQYLNVMGDNWKTTPETIALKQDTIRLNDTLERFDYWSRKENIIKRLQDYGYVVVARKIDEFDQIKKKEKLTFSQTKQMIAAGKEITYDDNKYGVQIKEYMLEKGVEDMLSASRTTITDWYKIRKNVGVSKLELLTPEEKLSVLGLKPFYVYRAGYLMACLTYLGEKCEYDQLTYKVNEVLGCYICKWSSDPKGKPSSDTYILYKGKNWGIPPKTGIFSYKEETINIPKIGGIPHKLSYQTVIKGKNCYGKTISLCDAPCKYKSLHNIPLYDWVNEDKEHRLLEVKGGKDWQRIKNFKQTKISEMYKDTEKEYRHCKASMEFIDCLIIDIDGGISFSEFKERYRGYLWMAYPTINNIQDDWKKFRVIVPLKHRLRLAGDYNVMTLKLIRSMFCCYEDPNHQVVSYINCEDWLKQQGNNGELFDIPQDVADDILISIRNCKEMSSASFSKELLNKDMGDSIPLMTLDQAKEYFYAAMKLGDGARHKRLFVIKNRLNERDRDLFQRWLGEEFGAHYLNHWKSHKVINLHKYNIQ